MNQLHDHERRVSPLLTRTEVRPASISIEKHVDEDASQVFFIADYSCRER